MSKNFQTANLRRGCQTWRRQVRTQEDYILCDFTTGFCLKSDRSSPDAGALEAAILTRLRGGLDRGEGGQWRLLMWTGTAPISGTAMMNLDALRPLCRHFPGDEVSFPPFPFFFVRPEW